MKGELMKIFLNKTGTKIFLIGLLILNTLIFFLNKELDKLNSELLDRTLDHHSKELAYGLKSATDAQYLPPNAYQYLLQYLAANTALDSLYDSKSFFEHCKVFLEKYQFKDSNNSVNRLNLAYYTELTSGSLKNCTKCRQVFFKENQWLAISPYLTFALDYDYGIRHFDFFREGTTNNCDKIIFGSLSPNNLKYIYTNDDQKPIITYDDNFPIDLNNSFIDSIKIYYPSPNGKMLLKSNLIWL
jgi:uncharacterized protein with PIN domain